MLARVKHVQHHVDHEEQHFFGESTQRFVPIHKRTTVELDVVEKDFDADFIAALDEVMHAYYAAERLRGLEG
jgi:hypothetical protein